MLTALLCKRFWIVQFRIERKWLNCRPRIRPHLARQGGVAAEKDHILLCMVELWIPLAIRTVISFGKYRNLHLMVASQELTSDGKQQVALIYSPKYMQVEIFACFSFSFFLLKSLLQMCFCFTVRYVLTRLMKLLWLNADTHSGED